MIERLQKILSAHGVASRRAAEQLITEGRVTVNGVVAMLGQSADPETDEIRLDGKLLPVRAEYVYIMLNKPRGFVTTLSDEQGRRTAAQCRCKTVSRKSESELQRKKGPSVPAP